MQTIYAADKIYMTRKNIELGIVLTTAAPATKM